MRVRSIVFLTLALTACAEPQGNSTPRYLAAATTTSLPPHRVQDCVTYELLDNKCTADWYRCRNDGERNSCTNAWMACCTLPGNRARTMIVTAPQTP